MEYQPSPGSSPDRLFNSKGMCDTKEFIKLSRSEREEGGRDITGVGSGRERKVKIMQIQYHILIFFRETEGK